MSAPAQPFTRLAASALVWALPALMAQAQTEDRHVGTGLGSASAFTLADAVSLALEHNPTLAVYSWDIRAAEARQIQARFRPNPELAVEAEDVRVGRGPKNQGLLRAYGLSAAGLSAQVERESDGGPATAMSDAQITVSLSQLIELGGKRTARIVLAARERAVAAWEYEVARATVLKEVALAFVELLVAQERVTLDNDMTGLAESIVQTVSTRVSAGRISPLELAKAQTALSMARVQADQSEHRLQSARTRLAALWGSKEASFERGVGNLDTTRSLPTLEDLAERVVRNPDLARWNAEIERRQAAVSIEKAAAVPDLTLRAGVRASAVPDRNTRSFGVGSEGLSISRSNSRPEGHWDNSIVLGFSVPLPIFNRNRGSIKEAEHLMAKAGDERRAADMQLHTRLVQSYQNLAAALTAASFLKKSILPEATQTFASIEDAYRQGKFAYIDVLDAQRTLFEARQQHLSALASYHENVAEIESVIGEPLWNEGDSASRTPEEK